MDIFAGIDVALEVSAVCVVDAEGRIVKEAKIASTPEGLTQFFQALSARPCRIGLEAGALSQWLYAGLRGSGFEAVLMETRQVKDAFKSNPVKTDRKDAQGLAQLVRLDWFKPVHCKSLGAQRMRALLRARATLRQKRHDIAMTIRGLLRSFGLKMGRVSAGRFTARVRELAQDDVALWRPVEALLKARTALNEEFRRLDGDVRRLARSDERVRLAMTAPGVGPVVGLTFVSALDEASRFRRSRRVGAYFGLTQKKHQTGQVDITGRISKCGDHEARVALYEAAHIILTHPVKGGALKSWAARLAKRAGAKKAKVALARKLAVILHRMLMDGTAFEASKAAA